jgi:hypothetical protein
MHSSVMDLTLNGVGWVESFGKAQDRLSNTHRSLRFKR